MRRVLMVVCMVGMMTMCVKAGEPLKVMSFNVRYDNPWDKENGWVNRRERVADAIAYYDADIVGTQEVLDNQLEDLKARLDEYGVTGVGREDGAKQGEYAALWYKLDRFTPVSTGNFWLSATPDVAGSLGWDGACVRIATWAVLHDKLTGKEVLALNTHLDHVGEVARREGVKLILERVDSLAGNRPVVVTGDFNSVPDSEVVTTLTDMGSGKGLTDSRGAARLVYGPEWTFHDYFRVPEGERTRIDYVLTKGGLNVKSYGVMAEGAEHGVYLSDHCPVVVNMEYVQ
ncbi:MAG: endonuclease/exonuclease/phosphatase family protein [Paramuribaculum sp.]|nr:endonuclease/exonuclease/phosphatase family protein [Paramuribaculum sp.]